MGLGANYAGSVLAGVATVACFVPILLVRYGKAIRRASKFARYSVLMYNANSADGTVAGSAEDVVETGTEIVKAVAGDGPQMEFVAGAERV